MGSGYHGHPFSGPAWEGSPSPFLTVFAVARDGDGARRECSARMSPRLPSRDQPTSPLRPSCHALPSSSDRELTDFSNQTGRRERWWRVVARGAEHPGDRRDEGQGVDIDRVGFSRATFGGVCPHQTTTEHPPHPPEPCPIRPLGPGVYAHGGPVWLGPVCGVGQGLARTTCT